MKTKNKKKSIIKKILAFGGAIFCSIVCAFSLFNINDTKSMEVSADEVIVTNEYFSSGLGLPCFPNLFRNGKYVLTLQPEFFYFRFILRDDADKVSIRVATTGYIHNIGSVVADGFLITGDTPTNSAYFDVSKNNSFTYVNALFYTDYSNPSLSFGERDSYYSDCLVYCSNDFNCNVSSIFISSSQLTPLENFSSSWFVHYNYIKFIDNNGNYLIFAVSFLNSNSALNPLFFSYQPRLYFLGNNFSDNQYYEQGYSDGQISGFDDGFLKGEEKGYSDGFINGRDEGYWEGKQSVLEGEQYSFTSLVASVIDVPVKTFTSLFNFEILGVNLSGFLLGLFTLSVAIFIIKLII